MDIKKFLGLRNNVAAENLKAGDLQVAYDVDLDDEGAVRSRKGLTQVAATAAHSLWAKGDTCLLAYDTTLKRMDAAGGLTTLDTLSYGGPISYAELNGVVYLSNGVDTRRVREGRSLSWGVAPPAGQPVATAGAGSLPPGRYMYAVTFLRSDGLESGTGQAGVIELTATGGIVFSSLPTSTNGEVSGRILYVSACNGTVMYRAGLVPMTVSSYSYRNGEYDLGAALQTQFASAAPAGSIVEVHGGRAFVVDGSVVWYSDQYALETFRKATNFLQFPGPVQLFASVEDGVFVATDKETWFLSGLDAPAMSLDKRLNYGAVPGTAFKFDGQGLVDPEKEQPAAAVPSVVWTTPYGVVSGTKGGTLWNMTEDRFSFPAAQRGAGLVRLDRGYTTYLAALRGTGSAPNDYE